MLRTVYRTLLCLLNCSSLCVAVVLVTGCGWLGDKKGPYDTDPLEPREALQSFQLVEGFRIELFAAEPDVMDPVEVAFDEHGNAYVAEMRDYPFDPAEGKPPLSRIRLLEDTDGDGKADRSTVFADKLLQATSVLPWKGGVLVAAAPDILFLKDTDGDRQADVREVLFTGFESHTVSPESRVTNLRYGIDNWIYAANNGRPGLITSPKHPDKPGVHVRGYDFRFHPEKGLFEPAAGPTQFGMSFDEWGNRFVSENTVHLRHVVLPARYRLNNPFFIAPSMLQYVHDDEQRASVIYPLTQPQQWRIERTEVRQGRYDETQPGRTEFVGGRFSAASGATVYVGDAFPAEYRGNVFVADANGNLVHRDVLRPEGATFRAERQPSDREFLASTDIWFRPVNFANAPDGNLYVVDFYREYIEEPASIPETIKQRLQLDFYRGNDRGRIYRIVPTETSSGRVLAAGLREASTAMLVTTLAHQNGWHRRTAQRRLIERRDFAAAPLLREMASMSESPQARLHALWTLEGLAALEPELVEAALEDEHPAVRANALRMAEAFLPELDGAVGDRLGEPDPQVRFQLLLTLGEIEGNHRAVARIVAENVEDPWFRAAALTAIRDQPLRVLTRLVTHHREFFDLAAEPRAPQSEAEEPRESESVEARRTLVSDLASLVGTRRDSSEITMFFITLEGSRPLRAAPWRSAALAGLARGLAIEGAKGIRIPSAQQVFVRFLTDPAEDVREAALEASQYFELHDLMRDAIGAAGSEEISIARRARAVRFLRGGRFDSCAAVLREILEASTPRQVQTAAVGTLATFDDPRVAEILLVGWRGYSPQVRDRVVETLLRHRDWAGALLDALERSDVQATAIDPVSRIRLMHHPDQDVQARAQQVVGAPAGDRAAVVESHRDVLTLESDPEQGKAVFEKHCASCHLSRRRRGRIGPDLSGVNNKSKEALLTHILDPSFEIEPRYTNYILVNNNGRIHDGLLVGETAHAVTLRGEIEDFTIPRKSIAEMRASDVSLMPEGLEADMGRQELADVIAYLRAGL